MVEQRLCPMCGGHDIDWKQEHGPHRWDNFNECRKCGAKFQIPQDAFPIIRGFTIRDHACMTFRQLYGWRKPARLYKHRPNLLDEDNPSCNMFPFTTDEEYYLGHK